MNHRHPAVAPDVILGLAGERRPVRCGARRAIRGHAPFNDRHGLDERAIAFLAALQRQLGLALLGDVNERAGRATGLTLLVANHFSPVRQPADISIWLNDPELALDGSPLQDGIVAGQLVAEAVL